MSASPSANPFDLDELVASSFNLNDPLDGLIIPTETALSEPTFMTNLKSYEPDLKVIVGDDSIDDDEYKMESFLYHGVILSNASEYIDTMLSMPMKEQMTRTISFPDIKPKDWLKWTNMVLVPKCARNDLPLDKNEELIEIIQFYDKYQFSSGTALVDSQLSEAIKYMTDSSFFRKTDENFMKLIMMICKGEIQLASSKKEIPYFLTKRFKFKNEPEENIKLVLSILVAADVPVREKKAILTGLVDVVHGVSIEEKSIETLESKVLEESFVPKLKAKMKEISLNKGLLDKLNVYKIQGNYFPNSEMNGEYRLDSRYANVDLGVMQNRYEKSESGRTYVIQSMDGLGSIWTISSYVNDSVKSDCICHYIWNHGMHISSILPPTDGWKNLRTNDDDAVDDDVDFMIDYSLGR